MQTFASLLRSCALLALFTGSSGQSVPAGTLDEIRVEFRAMNEVLRNENALKFEELEVKTVMLENKNEALRLELEDLRGLLQSQPRRTDAEREQFRSCMEEDVEGGNIYFTGCNVHIRSGNGMTDGRTNGKGNLIIGYNEPRAEGLDSRGGSHNLIIGNAHEYTSFGGIVTGQRNRISNIYSAVVGGYNNAATGQYSTVTGGADNEATGDYSSISGGESNTASGFASSISGGRDNTASGYDSSVLGGKSNDVQGDEAVVTGGFNNKASGEYSSVLGGSSNDAQGDTTVVTGGFKNKAIGDLASVVGGKRNKAWKKFSVVTGA